MAATTTISLHGAAEAAAEESKAGCSSAILLKLADGVLDDLKKASDGKDGVRFFTGNTPKLRIGSRSIDLTISADEFRNELFASSTGFSAKDFTFTSVVSHRAELKGDESKSGEDNTGSDAALAALQSSLASYEQEKQAKQANITNSVLPAPKNRFDAARKEKLAKKGNMLGSRAGSQPASPSLSAVGTPSLGAAPTSAPASEDQVKLQAMKKPVVHLLAMRPLTAEEVVKKTNIPRSDLDTILQKVARQAEGKWQLTDRACKELDVWQFEYPSSNERQLAIDNAVKAYDRLRLGKEDPLWQLLLPREERGKGKVLSRLHLGGGQVNKGLTPHYQPSPTPQADGANDSRTASGANTPRPGQAASTPRIGTSKGDVMKRLLSKNPQKARQQEDEKEKKRKEKEAAAASDRENAKPAKKAATKQATKKTDSKIKSEEIVHSSSDESEGEAEGTVNKVPPKPSQETTTKLAAKPKKTLKNSTSSESDVPIKSKIGEKAAVKAKPSPATNKATASPAVKSAKPTTTGKGTPQPTNNLSAPNSTQKNQRSKSSPQKGDSKPSVPSPLGAARPRVASDVSDRGALGVQRVKQGGAETPKGLGITNGVRKRHDTVTSNESTGRDKPVKDQAAAIKQQKPTTNGIAAPQATTAKDKPGNGIKRKTENPTQQREGTTTAKHRKTESSSSQSQKSHASSAMGAGSTPRTSPNALLDRSSSSDSAASVIDTITYNQGVVLAEKFRDIYYPAYAKMYDEQVAQERRGEKVGKGERERLLQMHRRLEQMKREIAVASQRERQDEQMGGGLN